MSRFNLIITLDYELPVHKNYDVKRYMVYPTEELLLLCEETGAKLTIMAEIGEIWAFEDSENECFQDYLGYDPASLIKNQLQEVVQRGHDVQLHLHPQWLGAKWRDDKWKLNYSDYRMTDLSYEQIVRRLSAGKDYLESILKPYTTEYECIGFRSGNWITQPSRKYLTAISESGMLSDSSVFKWGYKNSDAAYYDYRNAFSKVRPWFTSWDDINKPNNTRSVLELPIYSKKVKFRDLLTMKRIMLSLKYLNENSVIEKATRESNGVDNQFSLFRILDNIFNSSFYPKKLDYCKLYRKELRNMIIEIFEEFSSHKHNIDIPIVMIGHSKETHSFNHFRKFLFDINTKFGEKFCYMNYRDAVRYYYDNYDRVINQYE